MIRNKLAISFAALVSFSISVASAAPTFYVSNSTSNSVNWKNAVIALGGSVNTNVNFNAHPAGALQNNFYSVSDGVTFSTVGNYGGVVFGPGPGQANSGSAIGEGLHTASNYLQTNPTMVGGNNTTTTITFAQPVRGAGLFTIDFFDSGTPMTLSAYDGPNGTGTLLGTANAVTQNFQQNRLYFMGVTNSPANIRSIALFHGGATLSDNIGIDDILYSAVPEPYTMAMAGLAALGLLSSHRRWQLRTR